MNKVKNLYFKKLIQDVKKKNIYNSAGRYKSCFLLENAPKYIILKYQGEELLKPALLQKNLETINKYGIKTPRIIYYQKSQISRNKLFTEEYDDYCIQEKAKGRQVYLFPNYSEDSINSKTGIASEELKKSLNQEYCNKYNFESFYKILTAPDEHIYKLIKNLKTGNELGIMDDFHGANLFYDEEEGFTFLDLTIDENMEIPQPLGYIPSSTDNYDLAKTINDHLSLPIYTETSSFYNNLFAHKCCEGFKNPNLHLSDREYSYAMGFYETTFNDEEDYHKKDVDYSCTDYTQAKKLENVMAMVNLTNPEIDFNNLTPEDIENIDEGFQVDGLNIKTYLDCMTKVEISGKSAFEYFRDYQKENKLTCDEELEDDSLAN